MTTVETERRRMIDQLIEDAQWASKYSHEEKVAALLLALDMLDPANAGGVRYTKTVGKTTVVAQVSYEAISLAAQMQELVDELNSSC